MNKKRFDLTFGYFIYFILKFFLHNCLINVTNFYFFYVKEVLVKKKDIFQGQV